MELVSLEACQAVAAPVTVPGFAAAARLGPGGNHTPQAHPAAGRPVLASAAVLPWAGMGTDGGAAGDPESAGPPGSLQPVGPSGRLAGHSSADTAH